MQYIKNEQGQALLIVIVALTIALTIGINASVRTITSLSRTSRSDTASRALSAAEGGGERFLAISTADLQAAAAGTCPSGTTDGSLNGADGCIVSFASDTDIIDSEAFVTVTAYDPDIYPLTIAAGKVSEVNLQGYSGNNLTLCWTSVTPSDLAFIVYTSTGHAINRLLRGVDDSPVLPYQAAGFTLANAGSPPYVSCHQINLPASPYGLRVRSMGGDSNIGVFAQSGHSLPLQGYKIVSIGRLVQNGNVTATRKISFVKSLPYLPGAFDFSYYSVGDIVK